MAVVLGGESSPVNGSRLPSRGGSGKEAAHFGKGER